MIVSLLRRIAAKGILLSLAPDEVHAEEAP